MPKGFLARDAVTVPGQKYALVSFVGPSLNQKADKFGLKIRGCFGSEEEARAHAKSIMEADSSFDVYVVSMYDWLLIPPSNDSIQDTHYQEEYLEGLIQGYQQNQAQAKKCFEQRKLDVMRDGIDKHLSEGERLQRPEQQATPTQLLHAMQQQEPV